MTMHPSTNNSIFNHTTHTAETLTAMLQKERTMNVYCGRKSSDNDDLLQQCTSLLVEDVVAAVTWSDRMILVDWCYSVVDKCKFDRDTVAMAMNMVDRFLLSYKPQTSCSTTSDATQDNSYTHDRHHYQLLTMTALYIAIKINEPVAMDPKVFAATSGGIYSVQEIEDMELTILKGLEWRVYASSTSVQMAHYIMASIDIGPYLATAKQEEETHAMSLMEFILDEVRYQAELAVRDYYFSLVRPSTVAMAAIFNALDQVDLAACQHILEALLSSQLVMLTGVSIDEDENDDSFLQELFHVKARLTCMLESNECLQDEDIEDKPQLSDSSIRTLEASVRSFINEEDDEVCNIINDIDGISTTSPISTILYNIL